MYSTLVLPALRTTDAFLFAPIQTHFLITGIFIQIKGSLVMQWNISIICTKELSLKGCY